MTKQEFQDLLDKYEKGLCTPQEEKLLDAFLNNFQTTSDPPVFNHQEEAVTGDRIYGKITQAISVKNSTQSFYRSTWFWWGVLLLMVLATAYWGVNKIKNNTNEEAPVALASLVTTVGEVKKVTLDDGTIITINENTTIKYPEDFSTDGERKVELNGEAFFKVAKDSLRPFIVVSQNISTRVLGTSFNVSARSGEDQIKVALIEGKVEVLNSDKKRINILEPNEQLTYSKKEQTAYTSTFKGNVTYAWKEEIVLFDKATVREVIEVLSKKYKVHFQIEKEEDIKSLLVYRVNTEKYQLSQVLKHIKKVTDYQFIENDDGSITVRPK